MGQTLRTEEETLLRWSSEGFLVTKQYDTTRWFVNVRSKADGRGQQKRKKIKKKLRTKTG